MLSQDGIAVRQSTRLLTWALAGLFVMQAAGCAGSSKVTVLPSARRVTMVSPWRYYDLWQALRAGRGVVVGTLDGRMLTGEFVSGGAKNIKLQTNEGYMAIKVQNIRYLVNVIDLSHARDGAIAGGIIGLGTGFTLSYMTQGNSRSTSSARPARQTGTARTARATEYDDDESSAGDSESTNSESSSGTTPSASSTEGGESSTGDAYDSGQGASSESSSGGGDPTETGSSTYDDGSGSSSSSTGGTSGGAYDDGNTGSSGSSTGGGTTGGTGTTSGSNGSSGNSVVFVDVYAEGDGGGSGSSSGPATVAPGTDPGQPTGGGGGTSPAMRAFFYSMGFAALGTFVGWLIGRRLKRSVPRVDYVLFPANLDDKGGRSPDEYLADNVISEVSGFSVSESLPLGSGFDSPRSAARFDQFAHSATTIQLHDELGPIISAEDARAYGLFPTIENFHQATIVRSGDTITERTGTEHRYLAVVTYIDQGTPIISLQRMTPRDVVTLSTQVGLIRAGILQ
jgi:hypothetical protein